MKARLPFFVALIAVILLSSIPAFAIVPVPDSIQWDNTASCTSSIRFSGSTITCKSVIISDISNSTITASMTLYRVNSNGGVTWLKSWGPKNGTNMVTIIGTYSGAVSGTTYRLSVNGTVTVNGNTSTISKTITATCP